MEKTIRKTRQMTSYNVLAGEIVIAKADCWVTNDSGSEYVIEVVPYEGRPESAGIRLNKRELWDDFYDTEENSEIPHEREQVMHLLSTMIADEQRLRERVEVRRRKDVFDIELEKLGHIFSFIMVCQYECGISGNKSDTGIFIYDKEGHDIWNFPLVTEEGEMIQTIYPFLVTPAKIGTDDQANDRY